MEAISESSYPCPACGEEIVVPVDPTAGREQEYVEDCPVCCSPVVLRVFLDGERVTVDARAE
jgi:DNA replicative helicase MCM subunit Mcm2 (Cdc46/Mcm family)